MQSTPNQYRLNKYGAPHYYTGRIPCRCPDRKNCGKRKTLSKYPEEYKIKKFILCDCGKEFKVDGARLRARFNDALQEIDSGKKCTCDGIPYHHRKGQRYNDWYCNDYIFTDGECPF